MGNALPLRINNVFVYENDCSGAPLTTSEGGTVYWFPGKEATEIEFGPTFRTISAITTECFNRSAEDVTSGADGVIRLGCGFSNPEFDSRFLNGYTAEFDAAGNVVSAVAKPNEEACFDCAKTDSEECEPTFSIVADVCMVDCDNNVVDRQFMAVRSISQATLSNRKRIGGNNPDSFGGDINVQLSTNDGWGEGPADLVQSYDADGNPGCAPVICGVSCPPGIDFSALDEMCGCSNEFAGEPIDAAVVLANPDLAHPFITGVV